MNIYVLNDDFLLNDVLHYSHSEDVELCYFFSVNSCVMWHRRLLQVWWWFLCPKDNNYNTSSSISEEAMHCTGGPQS